MVVTNFGKKKMNLNTKIEEYSFDIKVMREIYWLIRKD